MALLLRAARKIKNGSIQKSEARNVTEYNDVEVNKQCSSCVRLLAMCISSRFI